MAPQSKDAGLSILTPDYMTLLQSMCKTTRPSVNDVIAAFKLFCAFFEGTNPNRSSVSSSSLSTSSCRAKKRGAKSAARSSAVTDNASGDGCGSARSDIGFERSCTWEPDQKACWIISDLHLWNRVLSRVCIELLEHKWGELTLQGYEWPENKFVVYDVLCASLLIHVLLRQHRCVTFVFLDMSVTTVESDVIWHALRTGAGGVKWLECRPYFLGSRIPVTSFETTTWSQAVVALTNLNILHIHCIRFSEEIARTLGGYVMRSTALSTLQLFNITAYGPNAGVFLDCLACNRTVKVLCVQEPFLIARQGQALAEVVRDHVTLEKLEVTGTLSCIPSALLAAVVQSKTLTSLAVHTCLVRTEDIEAMASALTLPALSPKCEVENVKVVAPATTECVLKELNFINCAPCDSRLQQAYAKLIGGVLVRLRLSKCRLGEAFAAAAAANLLSDRRLRDLNVADNLFSIGAVYNMIQALEVNKTLEALVVNVTGMQPQGKVSCLFDLIRKIDVFSRLKFNWVRPRGSDFAKGVCASQAPTIWISLDESEVEDAEEFLETLVSARNVGLALLECTTLAKQRVVQKLTDTLLRIKSLRHLILRIHLPDPKVINLFRSLEGNRSIAIMEFRGITFRNRTAKALGRLLESNRTITSLNVNLEESDLNVDRMVQFQRICRQLNEALLRNLFVISITVNVDKKNRCNLPLIKEALRRNLMLVNRAVHFVNGSKEKKDAIAFENLQHCYSLKLSLCTTFNNSDQSAIENIAEARKRLAFDYFILVGVVKTRIACHPHRKRKTTFDKLGKDLHARICSYLCLTDVLGI